MATILLVDDNEVFRKMALRILQHAGYQVREASDGGEALRCFAEAPVDLVITDVLMPQTDGVQFISELRQRSAGIPIIAISGGGLIDASAYLSVATCLGVAKILTKPFDAATLLENVHAILGDRKGANVPQPA